MSGFIARKYWLGSRPRSVLTIVALFSVSFLEHMFRRIPHVVTNPKMLKKLPVLQCIDYRKITVKWDNQLEIALQSTNETTHTVWFSVSLSDLILRCFQIFEADFQDLNYFKTLRNFLRQGKIVDFRTLCNDYLATFNGGLKNKRCHHSLRVMRNTEDD